MVRFKNPLYWKMWDMVNNKDQGCLVVIVGKPRTGKSYIGLDMASSIDPKFNARTVGERCAFKPTTFMKLCSEAKKKMPKGSAMMYEEAGVNVNAKEWYSWFNRSTSYLLQTFGHRNFLVIFTVPNMDYITGDSKKLMDFCIETLAIDKRRNLNIYKAFEWSYNSFYSKYFRKHLIIAGKRYKIYKVKKSKKKKMLENYEEIAIEYKKNLAKNIYKEAMYMEKEEKESLISRTASPREIAKAIINKHKDNYTKTKKRTGMIMADPILISYDFKLSNTKAMMVKKLIERELNK